MGHPDLWLVGLGGDGWWGWLIVVFVDAEDFFEEVAGFVGVVGVGFVGAVETVGEGLGVFAHARAGA